MASILIVPKQTVPGKLNKPVRTRWHVRWERGKDKPIVHLGVFDTETRAKKMVRDSLDKLARGEMPTKDPDEAQAPPPQVKLRDVADRWLERRLKIADSTRESYQNVITNHVNERWGDDDPASITTDDVQDWIAAMSANGAKPKTIRVRLSVLRAILRHAKVKPNPATDEEIELPRDGARKNRLPSKRELDAFYPALAQIAGGKYVGVVRLMEHSGLRIHEAVAVRHEHWDRRKHRLLIPDSKTYAGTRFIDQINGLPEIPPPGTGRVWPGITINATKNAVRWACKQAGIGVFSSHDLRRLHISRCLRDGMDPSLLAVRAGHSSPNITLTAYSKLVPPD